MQPVVVLIDQPAALLGRGPVLAGDGKRGAQPRRLAFDHRERLAGLAGDDGRNAGFENARLLGGDLFDGVAEKLAVIERHAGDDAGERAFDHVGGVEPAAEADFEQHDVGRMAREQQERRGRLDLEHRDRRIAVRRFAVCERGGEFGVVDQTAAAGSPDAEALVDAHQIGRGVDVNALARPLRGWRA